MLFRETERRQQLIEDLHRTRAELAETERTAGELAERERLAREIHDTVAQGLSSIQMLLHAAETEDLPTGAADKIVLARRTASAGGLADARRLIAALSPADLAGNSLVDALDRVCDRAAGGDNAQSGSLWKGKQCPCRCRWSRLWYASSRGGRCRTSCAMPRPATP